MTQNVLLICGSIAFCVAGLEGVCTALEPKNPSGFATTISPPAWLRASEVTGWEPATPGSVIRIKKVETSTGDVVYDAHYTIDDFRNRATKSAASGPAVAFFGDSFTYGEGVEDAETMPQQFANMLGGQQRTVNLAFSGYSPQQFLREVETGYKDDVIGTSPIAFVFLTSPFHAARTACRDTWVATAPRYHLINDKVTWAGTCDSNVAGIVRWLESSAAYRRFSQPLRSRLTHDDIALYIRILAQAVQLSKKRYDVETLVPYIPAAPGYLDSTGYTDAQVQDELKRRGVRILEVDLPNDPAATIPKDGHPTPYGHHLMAKMVLDKFRRDGGFPRLIENGASQ